jgi:hypothetical protein
MSNLAIDWRSARVPKKGHTDAECEDAIDGDLHAARFVVADGASESFAAGLWARILVADFLRVSPSELGHEAWLEAARARWRSETTEIASSWYAEQKIEHGAFATFLGIEIFEGENALTWRALGVGDSCLFRIVAGKIVETYPYADATEFNDRPELINSQRGQPMWQIAEGTLQAGDRLLIATDAMSQRIFSSHQHGEIFDPDIVDDAWTFTAWIEARRADGSMKNDDVALGVIDTLFSEPPQ